MHIYRLSKTIYSDDLTGTGCLFFPGRWNKLGTRVLYTSENVSLAILEVLANSEAIPKDYCIIIIEVPDGASMHEVEIKDLPANWNASPYPDEMAQLTEEWIREGKHLLMKVPSVHSPLDYNMLVNPIHEAAKHMRMVEKIPYFFDVRLKNST